MDRLYTPRLRRSTRRPWRTSNGGRAQDLSSICRDRSKELAGFETTIERWKVKYQRIRAMWW